MQPSDAGRVLAIDPGNRTGYAFFDAITDEPLDYGKLEGHDTFLDWLESSIDTYDIITIVIERYRVRTTGKHRHTNTNSDVPTAQLIGAIKRVARKAKINIVEQDPSPSLAIGLRFIGMHEMYVGKHVPDEISALAHGTYYLRKKNARG